MQDFPSVFLFERLYVMQDFLMLLKLLSGFSRLLNLTRERGGDIGQASLALAPVAVIASRDHVAGVVRPVRCDCDYMVNL